MTHMMENEAASSMSKPWFRYGIAVFGVAAMIAVRVALIHQFEGRYPLSLSVLPVAFAAWFGGLGPGFVAAVLSLAAGYFLPEPYNLQLSGAGGQDRLFLFISIIAPTLVIISRLRHARHLAEVNGQRLQNEVIERTKIEANLRREMEVRIKTEEALADALTKAEKSNNAKTEFLANMSHEIRTPMNAVVGLSSILAMSTPLTPKQKEYISTLKLSADSLLALINDMLDIAKIEASSVELESIAFNLQHLTEEVMNIMALKAREKNLDFVIESSGLPHADYVGDPTRIKQIMMNLCSNAIKFTDAGMVLIVLTATPMAGAKEMISISVKDTGIGINPEKIDKIFGKFIQEDSTINRKYGGSGLGLAITKNLVEIMGGKIHVESKQGTGSVFTVRIPLNHVAAIKMGTPVEPEQVRSLWHNGESPKVLLVEDSQANILVTTSFLEQFGFAFDVATNGIDALRRLAAGQYFAVLMDVQMPGLNGYEATRLIRENERRANRPAIPIIAMTAHAMASDRENCLEAGMNDYMAKPFDPRELEKKLRAFFEKTEGQRVSA